MGYPVYLKVSGIIDFRKKSIIIMEEEYMKKIIALLLAATMAVSLAACGSKEAEEKVEGLE